MTLEPTLVALLCCPHDYTAPLVEEPEALICPKCATRFPIRDGIVSFLSAQELSEQDHREREQRDQESVWYDPMFEGYTNAVEIPTAVRRIGRPHGVILDAGCGTGRITEALVPLGQPIVAVDYSEACLRFMMKRTAGAPVLAVQSDLRALPLQAGVIADTTCVEVYSQLRAPDRHKFLLELSRVMAPGAVLSLSAFNYNLMFKAWQRFGNEGARQGEHMLGGDYYYFRFTKDEFRRELDAVFDVEDLTGVRNVPARSIAQGIRKVGLRKAGDKFLDFMVDKGHQADFWLERTPLAGAVGFFWQAKARRRGSHPGAR